MPFVIPGLTRNPDRLVWA